MLPRKRKPRKIAEENEDTPKISSNNTLKVSLRILNKELEKDNDLLEIKEKRKIKDNEKIVAKISNYGSTEYYAVIKKKDFCASLIFRILTTRASRLCRGSSISP